MTVPSVVRYDLDCLHTNETDVVVKEGDTLTCQRCQLSGEVIKVWDRVWFWDLTCRDCRLHMKFGQAYISAKIVSGKHTIKYPGHHPLIRKVYDDDDIG